MLDQDLLEQLKGHFSELKSDYTFAVRQSSHAKQEELVQMLEALASTSDRITVQRLEQESEGLSFDVMKDGAFTGIRFRAVPGGHEFSSLILAILNADGKGRLPDDALQRRIKALRGPLHLRSFVSLSCTNCPDVVQALNQMALFHEDFSHDTVDGELVPEEVKRLGIQGVPAIFDGDHLIHVGKAGFGELLEVLEEYYGIHESGDHPVVSDVFDVVVLGGGPAGVAAAVYSARKGLKTAVVAQRMGGQVNDTLAIENLISVVHTEGPRLSSDLRAHLQANDITLYEHRRVEKIEDDTSKQILLQGGDVVQAQQIIVASGARWRELGVPGEKEYIGRGVAFCPHCDGPFFKNKRVAVIGGGNSGVEAAIDLAGICSEVTLFEFADALRADRVLVDKLHQLSNVQVITQARTSQVVGNGESVTAIHWQDRDTGQDHEKALDGIFVQIGLVPNSAMVKDLVEVNRRGEIVVDDHHRTSVAGIYAAGDVTHTPYKQIIISMGEGAKAALAAFEDRVRS